MWMSSSAYLQQESHCLSLSAQGRFMQGSAGFGLSVDVDTCLNQQSDSREWQERRRQWDSDVQLRRRQKGTATTRFKVQTLANFPQHPITCIFQSSYVFFSSSSFFLFFFSFFSPFFLLLLKNNTHKPMSLRAYRQILCITATLAPLWCTDCYMH